MKKELKKLHDAGAKFTKNQGWYLGEDAHFGAGNYNSSFLGPNAKEAYRNLMDLEEYENN